MYQKISLSELESLQQTLNVAIEAFRNALAAEGLPEPTLTTSLPHPMDALDFLPSQDMFKAQKLALASIGRIKSLIEGPNEALLSTVTSTLDLSCLCLCAKLLIPDLLGTAEDGLPINEIAKKTGVDAEKLAHILRCLAAEGWFRETVPNVFANSRLSNTIKSNMPGWWYAITYNEDMLKVFEHFPEAIKGNHEQSAMQLAYNLPVTTSMFGKDGWLNQNAFRAEGFPHIMECWNAPALPALLADYPWAEIAEKMDTVIDVGGGQGELLCALASKFKNLRKLVLQELSITYPAIVEFLEKKGMSERIQFEAQNFFQPQQQKENRSGRQMFILHHVIHNWRDPEAAQILQHLRESMTQESVLLIIDALVSHGALLSSHTTTSTPPFIPNNFGAGYRSMLQLDLLMMATLNTTERTLEQVEALLATAGLRLRKVYETRSRLAIVEAVVAE